MSSHFLRCILEELQMKLLMYLSTDGLITLCYVSKCIRDLVLMMPLFSIFLHFLRCTRSCDKKSDYCRGCSRVCEFFFFFECNAFSNLCVCSVGTHLDCRSSDRLDLDVFFNKCLWYPRRLYQRWWKVFLFSKFWICRRFVRSFLFSSYQNVFRWYSWVFFRFSFSSYFVWWTKNNSKHFKVRLR